MKKIKILNVWIYEGKKYLPGAVVDIPEKVYNNLKTSGFPFEDIAGE